MRIAKCELQSVGAGHSPFIEVSAARIMARLELSLRSSMSFLVKTIYHTMPKVIFLSENSFFLVFNFVAFQIQIFCQIEFKIQIHYFKFS